MASSNKAIRASEQNSNMPFLRNEFSKFSKTSFLFTKNRRKNAEFIF